jgi:hypothetical protein
MAQISVDVTQLDGALQDGGIVGNAMSSWGRDALVMLGYLENVTNNSVRPYSPFLVCTRLGMR